MVTEARESTGISLMRLIASWCTGITPKGGGRWWHGGFGGREGEGVGRWVGAGFSSKSTLNSKRTREAEKEFQQRAKCISGRGSAVTLR